MALLLSIFVLTFYQSSLVGVKISTSNKTILGFVDEFGDPGLSLKSSQTFTMVCVLVAEESLTGVRDNFHKIREKLTQGGPVLHWREHARTWDRRQFIAKEISKMNIQIVIATAVKQDLRAPFSILSHRHPAVVWPLQFLLERSLLASRDWHLGPRNLELHVSRIRGIPDSMFLNFIDRFQQSRSWIPWNLLDKKVRILENHERDGLQLADQIAGIYGAAIQPHVLSQELDFSHLKHIFPLIRSNHLGNKIGYGIKESSPFVTNLVWWEELNKLRS